MKDSYLVGVPIFSPDMDEDGRFPMPISQIGPITRILRSDKSLPFVIGQLREEYWAIISGLCQMKVDFRVVFAHPDKIDVRTLQNCLHHGIRFLKFPANFPPSLALCPRDLAVTIPGYVLVNSAYSAVNQRHGDCKVIASPLGEGGSVLIAKNRAVVCDRIISENGNDSLTYPTGNDDITPFKDSGMETVMFPAPAISFFCDGNVTGEMAFNNHCDRVACLVSDTRGGFHLVVDHNIITARVLEDRTRTWRSMPPEETLFVLNKTCRAKGITVHRAPKCRVPYALNLLQVADGRILMTGGAIEISEMLRSITGQEVITTKIPIQYFPAWAYAGIHCLVTEFPNGLFAG